MCGALLRSGKIEAFDALGETGAPIYKSALQIREALKRRAPTLEQYLAIPQLNQAGDQIDWYSPVSGQVIPWTSATDEERAPARERITALKAALELLSADLLAKHDDNGSSDKKTFAKLLGRVAWFPSEEFVYLVAPDNPGKSDPTSSGQAPALMPVLTFWGFDTPAGDRSRNPLHCLYPPVAPPLALVAPLAATPAAVPLPAAVPATAAEAQKRPWWRRWWWLLLLPLLALLLFGLKACVPTLQLPGMPSLGIPQISLPSANLPALPAVNQQGAGMPGISLPDIKMPDINMLDNSLPDIGLPGIDLPSAAGTTPPDATPPDATPADGAQAGATPPPLQTGMPNEPPSEPLAPPALSGPNAEPNTGTNTDPATDPAPETQQATAPLTIPSAAGNGAAGFLNGQWRAGAGIQDSRSGKPLRLEYQFQNGQGAATVSRGDGVSCSGPVAASMQSGTLNIVPGSSATCSDGSQYQLPEVACQQNAGPAANCTGLYEGNNFPLSMRQANN